MLTGPRPDSPLVASPPGFSALNKVLAPAFYEKDTRTGLPTGRVFDEQGNVLSPNSAAYQVVVYGSTIAACSAAIAAARQNKRVLWLSETERIGGMVAWGFTRQDIYVNLTPAVIAGITKEHLMRIAKNETNGAKTWQRFHRGGCDGKPSEIQRALNEMVAQERNIEFVPNAYLSAVSKTGTEITGITVTLGINGNSVTVSAPMFIDASYCGDLAAAAGCTMTVGRESTALYSESAAGVMTPTTFALGSVDPYIIAGNAGSGLLPWVDAATGTVGSGDGNVMSFNYRLFVTTVVADQIPFPAPDMTVYAANLAAGYYELMGRAMAGDAANLNTVAKCFALYANTWYSGYYDLNGKPGVSTNYPNWQERLEYVTASHARRKEIEENAKQWILGLLYWIQYSGDARIPGALVTDIALYGLVASEYRAYGGFSPEFYVREARRLVGDFVLTQPNISLASGYTDGIAYAYYPYDSPQVRFVNVSGVVKIEGSALVELTLAQVGAPIPYRVLCPKAAEITNLLCPRAPSVSQYAWRTVRMEQTIMSLGEAAGVAAAMAVEQDCSVQTISTTRLQKILDLQETWKGITLCVDGTGYPINEGTITTVGSWSDVSDRFPYVAKLAKSDGNTSKGAKSLKFAPQIREQGEYEVLIKYPPDAAGTIATDVPVTISHADGTATRVVDMSYPGGQGGGWESLGVFYFRKGSAGAVSPDYVLVGTTATTQKVVVSAVQWRKVLPA